MGVRMLLARDPKSQLFSVGHCQGVHICTNENNNHVRLLTDNVSEDVIGDTMLMCYMVNLLRPFCTLVQLPLFICPF